MDKLAQLSRAVEHVSVDWDESQARLGLSKLQQRHRRGVLVRSLGASLAVASVALVVIATRPQWDSAARATPVANAGRADASKARAEVIRLDDGSAATPLGRDSHVAVTEQSAGRTGVRLTRGRGHFAVVHRPSHVFEVYAGDVVISVVGTEFTVEKAQQRVGVWVHKGRVRVSSHGEEVTLQTGENRWFGEEQEAQPLTPEQLDLEAPGENWRALAGSFEYGRAYEVLQRSGVRDSAEDLLLAADVARLSGHPAQAVPYLLQVVRAHGASARAALASFTLGRVLLENLGQPVQAAQAFAEARRLGGGSALAEDALFREVQAWSQAGNASNARNLAEQYLKQYPSGLHLRAVRALGGLE